LARLIVGKYSSLEELMKASSVELAAVGDAGSKRKLGKAVAERLFGLLHRV
jgi:hypothetical protein